ncbi:unnamed protein product [Lactuca saligna]|uniref:Uncharacterized protein n=1 Tax=Lactuca saligna TaxID=75948 RepID=A0AA35ZV16_LACSI|nr:unnamed protein product [Lactuca saligna]
MSLQNNQQNHSDQSLFHVEDFLTDEETFSSGSSSTPLPLEHDSASIKLAKLLAFQDSIPQSKEKGIYIGFGQRGDEDSQQTISELKQEIVILKQECIQKDLLIGNLDVRVSELEKENSQKTLETFERVEVRPAPDSNLDQILSSGPATAEERKEK